MYSDNDLQRAADAGIFRHEQISEFRDWYATPEQERLQESHKLNIADEEQFRLVSSFNDIFVVIASVLTIIAVFMIGDQFNNVVAGIAGAAVSWGLSEYFILRKRMALPAIVLMLSFVISVFYGGAELVGGEMYGAALASAAAALAAYCHWVRFHVPITVAALVGAGVGFVLSLCLALFPFIKDVLHFVTLALGVVVFFIAMHWDSQDVERLTRKSDVAFWLHLLASPLLVHSVFSFLEVGTGGVGITLLQAAAVLVTYLILAFISVAIDRRALMVSGLIYVVYTFSTLLKEYGVLSLNYAITILLVGGSLLLLSVYWHSVRNKVVTWVPSSLQSYLVPLK